MKNINKWEALKLKVKRKSFGEGLSDLPCLVFAHGRDLERLSKLRDVAWVDLFCLFNHVRPQKNCKT